MPNSATSAIAANNLREENNLHFESRNKYDYFRIDGATLNYDILMGRLQAIARRRGRCKRNLILVENNFRENLSLVDLFRVITDLSEIGYSGFHLALADSNPEHEDNNQFANNVALNRGLRMRAFGSVADAEGWLMTV